MYIYIVTCKLSHYRKQEVFTFVSPYSSEFSTFLPFYTILCLLGY